MFDRRSKRYIRSYRMGALVLGFALLFSLIPTAVFAAADIAPDMSGYGNTGGHCRSVHVVHRGQTLSQIAARYGVNMYELARNNNVRNMNRIYVGQRLCIPHRYYAQPAPHHPRVQPAPHARQNYYRAPQHHSYQHPYQHPYQRPYHHPHRYR